MRSLRGRVEALERAAQIREGGLHVVVKKFAVDPRSGGTIKVAGAFLERFLGESAEAHRERAFSLAPVVGAGVCVIEEYEDG